MVRQSDKMAKVSQKHCGDTQQGSIQTPEGRETTRHTCNIRIVPNLGGKWEEGHIMTTQGKEGQSKYNGK